MKKSPSFDKDGYPTNATLKAISEWPYEKGFMGLIEYVKEVWRYTDYFQHEHCWPGSCRITACTGGWSGNEDIIKALRDNKMFWNLCWYQSTRGGKFEFHVPVENPETAKVRTAPQRRSANSGPRPKAGGRKVRKVC